MVDKDCLISVIVPVYKVEKFLHECIDSILAQTYENFELILVDDGSPDNCPQICDEYAIKDNRVTVIHQENKGVSSARNAGIKVANGRWIMFVDSDDWIEKDMLEYLLSGDLSCDVIACGVKSYGNRFFKEPKMQHRVYDLYQEEDLFEILKMKKYELRGPCAKIYKKQCLVENCTYFKEGVVLSEDKIFNIEVFQTIDKLQLLPLKKYHYRVNKTSASYNCDSIHLEGQKDYFEFCINKNQCHVFDNEIFRTMCLTFNKIFSCLSWTYFQKKLQMKNILNQMFYNKILKSISIWHIDFKYWIIFLLLKCHFYFGIYAIYLIKEFFKKVKFKLKG